ncbi:hypothetical protein D9M69_664540 [compost metagenome]
MSKAFVGKKFVPSMLYEYGAVPEGFPVPSFSTVTVSVDVVTVLEALQAKAVAVALMSKSDGSVMITV